jgi:hypothetical protein
MAARPGWELDNRLDGFGSGVSPRNRAKRDRRPERAPGTPVALTDRRRDAVAGPIKSRNRSAIHPEDLSPGGRRQNL